MTPALGANRAVSVEPRGGTAATFALPLLLLLLPFEPHHPTLRLWWVEVTLLEGAAAAVMATVLWSCRREALAMIRRPPLPVACLWAFAGAHVLSAAVAPAHRGLAFRFALRMVAAGVFALSVAASPQQARRRGLAALATASAVVAALAIVQGAGMRDLEELLDLFRPVSLGGARAYAGSENPNLAAGMLLYGFVSATALAALRAHPFTTAAVWAVPLSVSLLFTYSRGGLAAALLGLAALVAALARRSRRLAAAPVAALVVLMTVTALFASADSAFWPRVTTEAVASRYGARYEPDETRLVLAPGEQRTATVRVWNTGREAWEPEKVFFTCLWYRVEPRLSIDWASRCARLSLPRTVSPGEELTLEAPVRAPRGEGPHLLGWEMSDRHFPFSAYGVSPGLVSVRVDLERRDATAFQFEGRPGIWGRRRLDLWRLALRMWRDRPITGVGSDNFRWLNAHYGGWVEGLPWDFTQRAHNAYLEAAATTGTLGLLALLATLAATARAALSALRAASAESEMVVHAALFALLTGIVAQAMVDTPMAFTGHYLLMAFVVGASVRPRAI